MMAVDLALASPPHGWMDATGERPFDVAIIMSTFNSGTFLPEQLESLQSQLDVKWKLIWRQGTRTSK
jgi:hypothetical protein